MEYCFKMTTELMADNQALFSPLFIKKKTLELGFMRPLWSLSFCDFLQTCRLLGYYVILFGGYNGMFLSGLLPKVMKH